MNNSSSLAATSTDPIPVEDESVSNSQEAVPVPFWAGKRKVALRIVIYGKNFKLIQAKDDATGKKGT